jgi:hypothetical protein
MAECLTKAGACVVAVNPFVTLAEIVRHVETVGLGSPMLARHRHTRGVAHLLTGGLLRITGRGARPPSPQRSAQRYSIVTFCPSMKSASLKP